MTDVSNVEKDIQSILTRTVAVAAFVGSIATAATNALPHYESLGVTLISGFVYAVERYLTKFKKAL